MKSNATPKLSFVFDRKKKATKTVEAPVEILVYYNYKKKYLTTSASLYAGQWLFDRVVNRADAASLNKSLADMYVEVNNYIYKILESGAFSLSCLDKFKSSTKNIKKKESADSPFLWMEERLSTRKVRESTRNNHLRMIDDIRTSGLFKTWKDFTPANILRWDDRLKKRLNRQTSIHCYHKRLKLFLHEAEIFGMIKQDPYDFIKIEVGHAEEIKYLTKDERRRIEHLELEGPEEKARDLFIFACYTGLSFCDLQKIRVEDIKYCDGQYIIEDKRQKTGSKYHIVLLPQAMNILKKYDFNLNIMTNQKANWYLKSVQALARIQTRLTMHVGRHTFATWALSEGIAIETVSKMLAHSNIQVTQIYAKVLPKSVNDAFNILKEHA